MIILKFLLLLLMIFINIFLIIKTIKEIKNKTFFNKIIMLKIFCWVGTIFNDIIYIIYFLPKLF